MHYLYVTYIHISILNLWTTTIYAWKLNKNGMASKRDQVIISQVRLSINILSAWCNTEVTALLTQWSYCRLISSHRYKILSLTFCSRTRGPMQCHCYLPKFRRNLQVCSFNGLFVRLFVCVSFDNSRTLWHIITKLDPHMYPWPVQKCIVFIGQRSNN